MADEERRKFSVTEVEDPQEKAGQTPPTLTTRPGRIQRGGALHASVRHVRFRPPWHKGVGGLLIVAGLALFVICEANTFGIHDYGGHIWYLVGIGIAASSTWWFGLFDPAK